MQYAPIIVFVYNRPDHTRQTLEALSQNNEAAQSILYIYADGPKATATDEELKRIKETREVIRARQWCREVHYVESPVNKGLANSVIDGTTEIVNKYDRVITLEDDVVCSKYFLQYMNRALEMYQDDENVFMISGYNFPVKSFKRTGTAFFLPVSTTQAWGTWKRAWSRFDVNATGYEQLKNSEELRARFDLDNSFSFADMLFTQMETKSINSWAIRFWWSVFNNNGLVLYPDKSLIKNIGWDGSGIHSGQSNPFFDDGFDTDYKISNYPDKVKPDNGSFDAYKHYLKIISGRQQVQYAPESNIFKKIFSKAAKSLKK